MLTAMPASECWALVNGGQVLPLSASPGVRWRAQLVLVLDGGHCTKTSALAVDLS